MSSYTLEMMLDRLYAGWFAQADTNQDGQISGPEAVAFFISRAGLPQPVLGQVWTAGSHGAPALDRGSFRTICQLIWYAQNSGNELPANSQAMVAKIVSGMVTLPPPRLEGLVVPPDLVQMKPVGIVMPKPVGFSTLGVAGAGAPSSQMPPRTQYGYSSGATGGQQRETHQPQYPPPGAASHYQAGATGRFSAGSTGMSGASGVGGFSSGVTGQVPMVPAPDAGQFGAAPTGQPTYPAITQALAAKYAEGWRTVEKDAAGLVPGIAVLRLVASVPLDRAIKKVAWDLVAGNRNALAGPEFFTMLYLLDLYPTRGSMPDQIPPGIFPPGVHACFQAAGMPVPGYLQPPTVAHVPMAQQNPVENLNMQAEAQGHRAWSMAGHVAKQENVWESIPQLPGKAQYSAERSQGVYPTEGRLPRVNIDALSAMGNTRDAQRLQAELSTAAEKDRGVWEHEQSLDSATKQAEFYTKALQELILFKGRSERTLLDVQSRAEAATREAAAQKLRYEAVYEGARHASSQNDDLQKDITDAMKQKAEWESKLSVLTQELQSLAAATPETLAAMDQQIAALEAAVGESELEKAQYEAQTSGRRLTKIELDKRLQGLKERLEGTKIMAEKCQERVTAVKGDLDAARAEEDPSKVPPLLTAVAALYRDLHAECRASDLPVPEDAAIASNVDLVWREDDVLGADDLWTEFPNAGWSLVESLPGLPDGFARSYFLSLAEQQPAGGLTAPPPPNAYGEYVAPKVDTERTEPPPAPVNLDNIPQVAPEEITIDVPGPPDEEAAPGDATPGDSDHSEATHDATPMDETSGALAATADSPAPTPAPRAAAGDAVPAEPLAVAPAGGATDMDSQVAVPTTAPAAEPAGEELASTFSGMLRAAAAKPAPAPAALPVAVALPVDVFASMLSASSSAANLGSGPAFGSGTATPVGGVGGAYGSASSLGRGFGAGITGGALPADLFSEPVDSSDPAPASSFAGGVTGQAAWTAF